LTSKNLGGGVTTTSYWRKTLLLPMAWLPLVRGSTRTGDRRSVAWASARNPLRVATQAAGAITGAGEVAVDIISATSTTTALLLRAALR
jgi:hypothetical protein